MTDNPSSGSLGDEAGQAGGAGTDGSGAVPESLLDGAAGTPLPGDNPFASPSTLPYALPPFALIREAHYAPAFGRGMAEQRAEVAAIAGNRDAPSFANTVLALELSGALLDRVQRVYFNQASSHATSAVEELQTVLSPRLAAHRDAIFLDSALFARVEALYASRDSLELSAEELRLLEHYRRLFVRAGAQLSEPAKARLRELNASIAGLSTAFEQNLRADTEARGVLVSSAAELDGLTPDALASAAADAEAHGHPGQYLLSLGLPTNQPVLASLTSRPLRERVLKESLARGSSVNDSLVVKITRLRAERAALLGYPSHAAYQVEDKTARTTEAVEKLLRSVVPAVIANARREEARLIAAFERDGFDAASFAPWDWRYYAEKVRQAEYSVDASALRPYFELERVLRDGVFFAAGQVYGLRFAERTDLAGYHPDCRVFEVFNEDDSPLGLFVGDFYTRPTKRGGAWMNELVSQSDLHGARPVVVNNLNIAKPPAGEPTLLTPDEVRTLFHEFGHALHGLFSDVRFPSFAGTEVPSDFVEFPSQVNEMWLSWPAVLEHYARHVETGAPLPAETMARLQAAAGFGEGFRMVELLGAQLLDWAWHTLADGDEPGTAAQFEAAALEREGIAFASVPPRYRSTYFAHVFVNDYSAGYYSYLWSEVLDADTVEWFKENGGMDRGAGDRFREMVLSKGQSVEPIDAYREFRGRDADIEPLLKRRGLVNASA